MIQTIQNEALLKRLGSLEDGKYLPTLEFMTVIKPIQSNSVFNGNPIGRPDLQRARKIQIIEVDQLQNELQNFHNYVSVGHGSWTRVHTDMPLRE